MKKWAVGIVLLIGAVLIAANTTQVFAPFFKVAGNLTAGSITANTMAITTTTGTNMTLTGTVSADSVYGDTVAAIDVRATNGVFTTSVNAGSLYVEKLNLSGTLPAGVDAKIADGTDTGTDARLIIADQDHGELILGDESQTTNNKYYEISTNNADFYITNVNDSYSPPSIQIFLKRNAGVTIGSSSTPVDSMFNVNGGIHVNRGAKIDHSINITKNANVTLSVFAGDSVVAADRIKAGDNSTFSYFDPGDAGLTQSSGRDLKVLNEVIQVDLAAFMSIPVYKWKYKPQYDNSNKEHYGAVAEDFQKIHGDGKTINYEKAFWYLWSVVQEQQRGINELKNKVNNGSVLGGSGAVFDSSK